MLDIEQLIPVVLTKEDLIELSSDMVVLEDEDPEGQDSTELLDPDARAFLQFYELGYRIYPYTHLAKFEKRKKYTVAAIVSNDPRTGDYTRPNGDPGKFMAIPLKDPSGQIDLMIWSDSEMGSLGMANIKKGDLLLVVGAKFNEGKRGVHITLAKPYVIKVNPKGFTKEHFTIHEQEFLPLNEIEDNVGRVVDVKGVLVEKGRLIDFDRKDGSKGKVMHIKIFDSTSTAPLTLWDFLAEKVGNLSISTEIVLRRMRIKVEDEGVVLHSSSSSEMTF